MNERKKEILYVETASFIYNSQQLCRRVTGLPGVDRKRGHKHGDTSPILRAVHTAGARECACASAALRSPCHQICNRGASSATTSTTSSAQLIDAAAIVCVNPYADSVVLRPSSSSMDSLYWWETARMPPPLPQSRLFTVVNQ